MATFSESHCAGHLYWHDMDSTHPRHDAHDTHQLAGAIEEVYQAIDSEIGKIIEAAGNGVRVYVFSPNGMGPLYHASWNLPEMLDYVGEHRAGMNGSAPRRRGKSNFWRKLRMAVPGTVQEATRSMLPKRFQDELVFRYYRGNQQWSGRRAFAVPNNDAVGAIRVNLRGRDRDGMVEPGTEYERLCDDICLMLSELRDPVSGRAVARRITRLRHEYHGPRVELLPDITVQWDSSFPWSAVTSPRFGTIELEVQDARTGTHTMHGFLLASGPGIPKGQNIPASSVYDLLPTVLSAATVQVPAQCRGRALFDGAP